MARTKYFNYKDKFSRQQKVRKRRSVSEFKSTTFIDLKQANEISESEARRKKRKNNAPVGEGWG